MDSIELLEIYHDYALKAKKPQEVTQGIKTTIKEEKKRRTTEQVIKYLKGKHTDTIYSTFNFGVGSGMSKLINSVKTKTGSYDIKPQYKIDIGYRLESFDLYTSISSNSIADETTYLGFGLGIKHDFFSLNFSLFNQYFLPTIAFETSIAQIKDPSISYLGWGNSLNTGLIYSMDSFDLFLGASYEFILWNFPEPGIMNTHANIVSRLGLTYFFDRGQS